MCSRTIHNTIASRQLKYRSSSDVSEHHFVRHFQRHLVLLGLIFRPSRFTQLYQTRAPEVTKARLLASSRLSTLVSAFNCYIALGERHVVSAWDPP